MSKILIDKEIKISQDELSSLTKFCIFAEQELKTTNDFTTVITADRDKWGIKTTAYYNPDNNLICIYAENRHIIDVCRSIAHEMTHMMQHDLGLITGPVKDVGGFHEDQANAKAGEIVKKFIYEFGFEQ